VRARARGRAEAVPKIKTSSRRVSVSGIPSNITESEVVRGKPKMESLASILGVRHWILVSERMLAS
jgi:hypothetical protein